MSNENNEVVEEQTPVKKWAEGDQTHGARGVDVKGLEGCIRVKGCRELGGVEVAIFETDVAFPHRSGKEKWTVKVIGMGDNGPMFGTKTRKEAMTAARHPSVWSAKCKKLAEKLAEEKAAKAEKPAESEEETVEEEVEA